MEPCLLRHESAESPDTLQALDCTRFGVLERLRIVKHSCTSAQCLKRQNMLDTLLHWSGLSIQHSWVVFCLLLCGSLACQAYRKTNESNPVTSQASWAFPSCLGRVCLQYQAFECLMIRLMCVVWTWNVHMIITPCNLS